LCFILVHDIFFSFSIPYDNTPDVITISEKFDKNTEEGSLSITILMQTILLYLFSPKKKREYNSFNSKRHTKNARLLCSDIAVLRSTQTR
jgi:hypothetical protein